MQSSDSTNFSDEYIKFQPKQMQRFPSEPVVQEALINLAWRIFLHWAMHWGSVHGVSGTANAHSAGFGSKTNMITRIIPNLPKFVLVAMENYFLSFQNFGKFLPKTDFGHLRYGCCNCFTHIYRPQNEIGY